LNFCWQFLHYPLAGVDSAWEQEKPEAKKIFLKASDSPPSTANMTNFDMQHKPFLTEWFWDSEKR